MSTKQPPISNPDRSWWAVPLICAALVLMVCAIYGQTIHFGFLQLDDGGNIYNEPMVTRGLSWDGLYWALTHTQIGRWTPLATISRQVDSQLFGRWAGGHHLTSLLIHAAASVSLLFALRALTGSLWRSVAVAALFAVHPLHVEAVAWVSARAEELAGLFFLLALWAYAGYGRSGSPARYVLVLGLFVLAVMSKSTAVTLPLILLLLDYWPLARIRDTGNFLLMAREKLPLLLISGMVGLVAVCSAKGYFNIVPPSFWIRLGNAPVACLLYLWQTFLPIRLLAYYSLPLEGWPWWTFAGSSAMLLGLTGVVILQRVRRPYLMVGWIWFLTMLLPVLGILFDGTNHSHADRYLYLPQIGICMALVWLGAEWVVPRRLLRITAYVVLILTIMSLMVISIRQTSLWHDDLTLWSHTAKLAPNDWEARNFLGIEFIEKKRFRDAESEFRAAIQANPDCSNAYFSLAMLKQNQGKYKEAIDDYREGLKCSPMDWSARYHLGGLLYLHGKLLYKQGERADGIACLQKGLLNLPEPSLLNDLAWMLATAPEANLRDGRRALELARKVIEVSGDHDPNTLDTLAAAYAETGDFPKALETARKAMALAEAAGNKELSESLRKEILLYTSGRPLRDPVP